MESKEKSLTTRAPQKFRKISELPAVTAPRPPPPKFREISELLAVTAPRPPPPRRNRNGGPAFRSRAGFQRCARRDRVARSLFPGDDAAAPKKKRKTAASESLLVGDGREGTDRRGSSLPSDNVDYPEAAEPDGVAGGGRGMNDYHFALKGSARRSFFESGAVDATCEVDYSVPIDELDDGESYMRFLNVPQDHHAEAEQQAPEAEMAAVLVAGGVLHEYDDDSMPTVLPWMTAGEFDDGGFDFDPFLNNLLQDDYACG